MNIKKLFIIPMLIISLTMTGCLNPNLTKENAEALVADFLEAYRVGDYDTMYSLTHDGYEYFKGLYSDESDSNSYMFDSLSRNMQYEIQSVKIENKEAVVNVHITNIDVEKVLEKVTATYISACEQDTENNLDKDDLLYQTTKFCFDQPDNELVEHDTVFNLIIQDKKWIIESNIMIYDDVTGGYMTYYYKNVVFSDLLNEMSSQQQ